MTIPADPLSMADEEDPRVIAVCSNDSRLPVKWVRATFGTFDGGDYEEALADGALSITLTGHVGDPLTWAELEDSGVELGRNGAGTVVALRCDGMVEWS